MRLKMQEQGVSGLISPAPGWYCRLWAVGQSVCSFCFPGPGSTIERSDDMITTAAARAAVDRNGGSP